MISFFSESVAGIQRRMKEIIPSVQGFFSSAMECSPTLLHPTCVPPKAVLEVPPTPWNRFGEGAEHAEGGVGSPFAQVEILALIGWLVEYIPNIYAGIL